VLEAIPVTIDVSPGLTRPRAFLGISFDESDKPVRTWFENLLDTCGFEVVTAEASEHEPLGEKVRRKIQSCSVSCFVLTKRHKTESSEQWLPPQWIPSEIGMAYDCRHRIAIFAEKNVTVEGIIPSIEDYRRFSRETLNEDIHQILSSVLSLRMPQIQEAIESLLTQNQLTPIVVLRALYEIMSNIVDIRRMITSVPKCSVVSLIEDSRPFLVLGDGHVKGIIKGTTWQVTRIRDPEEQGVEERIGTIEVTYTQSTMAHGYFTNPTEEARLKDMFPDISSQGANRRLQGWLATPLVPPLLQNADTHDIENGLKIIGQLLSLVTGGE